MIWILETQIAVSTRHFHALFTQIGSEKRHKSLAQGPQGFQKYKNNHSIILILSRGCRLSDQFKKCKSVFLVPSCGHDLYCTGMGLVRDNEFKITDQDSPHPSLSYVRHGGEPLRHHVHGPHKDHTVGAQPFISVNISLWAQNDKMCL